MQEYLSCWQERFTYVKGMTTGGQQNMALRRGEVNSVTTGIAGWYEQFKTDNCCEPWFVDGVYDIKTGKDSKDPNFPGKTFEELYMAKWHQAPSGDLYEAYLLAHKWRDTLQKSLWINKGNPNEPAVLTAVNAMIQDKEAVSRIDNKIGKYNWIVGADGDKVMVHLRSLIKPKPYNDLVWWFKNAYGIEAAVKPELLVK
jgi:hypothetical protein